MKDKYYKITTRVKYSNIHERLLEKGYKLIKHGKVDNCYCYYAYYEMDESLVKVEYGWDGEKMMSMVYYPRSCRYMPRKRTALDGKVWWCVFDLVNMQWSKQHYHYKYRTKKECQNAINSHKWNQYLIRRSK